jgi:tRNA 2-thiocytidine biosynthesis protein TtcA
MFKAMQNVIPSHLADAELYDFGSISTQIGPVIMGDTAFDEDIPALMTQEDVHVITL